MSVEKLVNVWNMSSLQQTVMRLKLEHFNPSLAISMTCVPLDHMFTGHLYFAALPGMGETDQENVRSHVLPCDTKKFGYGRLYHHS